MAFAEDLDAFLSTADFALAATLQGGAAVNVIFDRAALTQLGISSTNPVALAKATDVSEADVAQRKTLTISGTAFTLTDRQPVDDGAFVLLQLQAP